MATASGGLKSEEGFREGQVFLPISEAVLQLNASGLEYAHIRQFTCLWIDFEKTPGRTVHREEL